MYFMATVKLGRSPAQFWGMTLRELDILITEWSRMEEIEGQVQATRIAYATVMFHHGKQPEWKPKEKKTVIASDNVLLL
jgi:hypothetical protein